MSSKYNPAHKLMRDNPYVDTNRQGYLYNPQYANEWAIGQDRYHLIDKEKVVLWVHATEYTGIGDWFGKTLDEIANTNVFYVGGGANVEEFGTYFVFVRYRPTKIFSGDRYFSSPYEDTQEVEQFLDCLVSKFEPDSELGKLYYPWAEDFEGQDLEDEVDFSKLSESQLRYLLRKGLESLYFAFLENDYTQECLTQFGFTAYYETERVIWEGEYPEWSEVNLAILKSDFKNVEIVDTLSPINPLSPHRSRYLCPSCGDECTRQDIIDSTFEMGEVMCKECATAIECEICGERTKESQFAEVVRNYDNDIISGICTTCEEEGY